MTTRDPTQGQQEKTKSEVKVEQQSDVTDVDEVLQELHNFYVDPEVEKSAVRKLDLYVLPILGLFYFFAALDRSNIGNSGPAGLVESINITDSQFSLSISIFYVTYIIFEIPGTMLLKKLRPSRLLTVAVAGWSLTCIGMTFVSSYWLLILLRLILGALESFFWPLLAVYITGIACYTKEEIGLRMAILLSCAALSGAVGGLISYGFVQVKTSALEGYRFIFLLEGVITLACTPLLTFFLPDDPATAKFFTEEEREIILHRKKQRELLTGASQFNWKDVRIAVLDIRTYYSMIIQFCGDMILYGFSNFLPTILSSGLGFDKLKTQYLTIPVYAVSSISVLTISIISDRMKLRGPFILVSALVGLIGYSIILGSKNDSVKYFGCFLSSVSLYTVAGLNITWTSNNTDPYYRRTLTISMNQTFGNLSGVFAGLAYSHMVVGHSVSLGCLCVAVITVVLNTIRLRQLNNEKEQILMGQKEDPIKERTGDQILDFKYIY